MQGMEETGGNAPAKVLYVRYGKERIALRRLLAKQFAFTAL
jgi:hypothetical protein